ncbi:RDD family protein [Streptomonospora alba]|uniref:RDD family protein n=1 Tax=Streptomonospora alba TaxID=183763 RepID=UPI00069B571F|nr:RDD family protein [Streptomonospora alba]
MTHPHDPGSFDGTGGRSRQEPPRPGYGPAEPWQAPPGAHYGAQAPQRPSADPARRLVAAVVDLPLSVLILYAGSMLVMMLTYAAVTLLGLPDNQVSLNIGATSAAVLSLAALFCYHWLPVARRGQTPGKRIAGIRVVAADTGRPLSTGRAAGRAAVFGLLLLPCMLGHIVSGIMVTSDTRAGRSLLDRAAGTRVVAA